MRGKVKAIREIVINPPGKGWVPIDLKELWAYRELAWVFALRDIKIRYKQTVIGIAWAFIQPLVMIVIFNFVFGKLANIPSEGVPYPLFSIIGVSLWNYFSTSLSSASNIVISNESIIKKVYFPRLILPISSALTPLLDLAISFLIVIGLMFYYHYTPQLIGFLLLPLLVFITFLTASGVGMFFASLNLKYRDIRHALPFVIQLMIYATPVIYPASLLEGKFSWILTINPLTGIIEAARASLLGNAAIDFSLLAFAGLVAVIVFFFGAFRFKMVEKFFADIA